MLSYLFRNRTVKVTAKYHLLITFQSYFVVFSLEFYLKFKELVILLTQNICNNYFWVGSDDLIYKKDKCA